MQERLKTKQLARDRQQQRLWQKPGEWYRDDRDRPKSPTQQADGKKLGEKPKPQADVIKEIS